MHDIGIYSVGNIGAKLITFLLVPIYTYFIPDTAQFGYFDICLTATFLLSPIITLNLSSGLLRYLLDAPDNNTKQVVTTSAVQMLVRTLTISVVILLIISCFFTIKYHWLALALMLSVTANDVYGQLARGLGLNKVFVSIGIATAFLVTVLSLVMVALLGMGITGVFWANILARICPIIIVELRQRLLANHLIHNIQWREQAKQLLRYSLPLLPTVIIWWVLSFGDRWFVLWAVGAKANGVYAVAARFTGIIYTFAIIILQAWQETAILQYKSKDRDSFFSQIFTIFIFALCSIIIAYTTALKICYPWLVDTHYIDSLQYIYPMTVAAGIYSVANFLEMGYQCSQQTHRALAPSIVTCIVNVVLNLILAPLWGCWGVIAASTLSFIVFAIYRGIDTRRFFTLRPSSRVFAPIAMLALCGIAYYAQLPWWLYLSINVTALFFIIFSLPLQLRKSAINKIIQHH